MTPRNTHLLLLFTVALTLAILAGSSARAASGSVQDLQAISGTSPATQQCEQFVEYEPQIAVNPKDPKNIVAAWIEGVAQAIVVGVSKDGGRTWTQRLVPDASECVNTAAREDPRLAFDADGNTLYLASLCADSCIEDPTGSDLVVVRRSTDGGLHWDGGHVVTDPISEACADVCLNGEVSITADPKKSGVAYLSWTRHNYALDPQVGLKSTWPWPAYFSQTTNGGDDWSPASKIYAPPADHFPVLHDIRVLPDNSLLDVFVDYFNDERGNAHQMAIRCTASCDDAEHWSTPVEIGVAPDIKASDPDIPADSYTYQSVAKPAFDLAPDGKTAYVAWQEITSTTSSKIHIAKATSEDQWATWTELTAVKTESSDYNGQAFQPTLAVGAHGTIGVTYYDFRDDQPGDQTLDTDFWFAHSHDGGMSWHESRVAGPFDLRASSPLGEVDGLAATPDGFVADFVLAEALAPEPPQDIFFACLLPSDERTTGGGWLADRGGKKINFGFSARKECSGPEGELELNDTVAGVKIHLTHVASLDAVGGSCGSIATGATSLELSGTGSYNGVAASFRVCLQDGGEPGAGADRFYLACTKGCSYTTGARTPDDLIDGGNIQVDNGDGQAGASGCTAILDPLLASTASDGPTLKVSVYGPNQEPLANAGVTLTATSVGGVRTLSAVTGLDGTATFGGAVLPVAAEYIAAACSVESNAIELSPLG